MYHDSPFVVHYDAALFNLVRGNQISVKKDSNFMPLAFANHAITKSVILCLSCERWLVAIDLTNDHLLLFDNSVGRFLSQSCSPKKSSSVMFLETFKESKACKKRLSFCYIDIFCIHV